MTAVAAPWELEAAAVEDAFREAAIAAQEAEWEWGAANCRQVITDRARPGYWESNPRIYRSICDFRAGILTPDLPHVWLVSDDVPPPPGVRHSSKPDALLEAGPNPSILLIAKRCLQLKKQAISGGADTPEPLWRGVLSIAKHATPDAARELSEGHKDFNLQEMETKLEGITAPYRCETFKGLNPETCKGCEWLGAINSPMALGYEHKPRKKLRAV